MGRASKGIGGAVGGLVAALLVQFVPDMPTGTIEAIAAAVGGAIVYFSPKNAE